jgi:nanoRNase/pAp phosphatase (c-di-AMP/oligoRNAs hydrolase)
MLVNCGQTYLRYLQEFTVDGILDMANQAMESPSQLSSSNDINEIEIENKKAPCLSALSSMNLGMVAIFTGAGVDPDGLACGLVMKAIINKLGGSADIIYRGTFNRPQNKTMREILSLNVKSYSEINLDSYTDFISLDGPGEICPIEPSIIIDHHKPGKSAPLGNDVRISGSCSSILWEYAMEAGIDFTNSEGAILATAICIGTSTDTSDFKEETSTNLDYEAYAFCLKHKDHTSFLAILNWPKPEYYNEMFSYGWANKIRKENVLISGLGNISEGRSGVISDLAEKYAETHGINTSMVIALVDDEMVGSMRSSNPSHDVNEFMKTFGGGGKRGAGAFRMKLPPGILDVADDEDRQKIFDAFFAIMVKKTLNFAGDES